MRLIRSRVALAPLLPLGSRKIVSVRGFSCSRLVAKQKSGDDNGDDKDNLKESGNPPGSTKNVDDALRQKAQQLRARDPKREGLFQPNKQVDSEVTQGKDDRGGVGGDGDGDGGGQNSSPISKQERVLPIQLQYRPVFPGMASHFTSTDPKFISTVTKLRETGHWNQRVIAVMSKKKIDTAQLVTNLDDVYDVACCCHLSRVVIANNARETMYGVLYPQFRVKIGELVENVRGATSITRGDQPAPTDESPLDKVTVQWMKGVTALPNEPYAVNDDEIQQLSRKIIDGLQTMSVLSAAVKAEVEKFSQLVPLAPGGSFDQPDFLADFAASLLPKNEGLQEILEKTNVADRLRVVADLVGKEVDYMRVQEGIYKYGHDQTQQKNREMILHEYLRYIKRELGMDGDEKSRLADKFQERADSMLDGMPPDVRRVFEDEMNKFRSLEPNAGEYNTVRTYLDWLTSLPWGKYSQDKFVIKDARNILDKSHFGLKDVKERILEFLAVGKLRGTVDGKIICLAGPPGVGKTSIARSIADSLNRKFDRFSVGGLYDVSEIKGHRRTYVASLPGRIIQSLKKCQTLNPVILIDEIDKLARGGSHGDPSAALLEALDPEQNKAFQDTYMEVPVDLSRVLFVCTANNLDTIPAPLMDRMEVIHIPGYLPDEKVSIAQSYLTPKARRESGLDDSNVDITGEALQTLVMKYTRESGVRGLSKNIEKIFRKFAFEVVNGHEAKETEKDHKEAVRQFELVLKPKDLIKYVGVAPHPNDRLYEPPLPAGVAMGLGWTPSGGMPLFIESVIQEPLTKESKPKFTRTGQLGEVMNESTSIAYSFVRMFIAKKFPRNRFLDFASVHTHFPEGAIKKDGPSAGIAMATSLLSLAMNTPANPDVAMTGELSLTGKVLQIGGLREKSVAARTLGIKTIIFPEDNRAEWEDLPLNIREGIEARPVKSYEEVFPIMFGHVDPAVVNSAWPEIEGSSKRTSKQQTVATV